MRSQDAIAAIRGKTRSVIMKGLGIDPIIMEYDKALGLPVLDYGTRSRTQIGRRVNPLHVALYACKKLALENITGPIYVPRLKQTETHEYVHRAADWLISTQKDRGAYSVWEYDFPWPPAQLRPPWISALTEAFGALVLSEAGRETDARQHLQSMLTDFKEGGVGLYGDGSLWFLEYPSSSDPPLVLNCMLHCLLILRECWRRTRADALETAFQLAYKTLKHDIAMFDASFYTYYDSHRKPADQKYHKIHVALLRLLQSKTGDLFFLPWISRWTRYQSLYPYIEPIAFVRGLITLGVVL